jgi:hypothetical protein
MVNLLQFNTCTRKQRGKSLCDKSTSKIKSQERNVMISHLHKQTMGGGGWGLHVINQHAEAGTKK